MITLNKILEYMEYLRKFYCIPNSKDMRFCIFSDGSASVLDTNGKRLVSFDTIQDLERGFVMVMDDSPPAAT